MKHTVEEKDDVTIVTLNRAPMNALDLPSIRFLENALTSANPDKPLVLTGEGPAFSAGVDTKAYPAYSADERQEMVLGITSMTSALLNIPSPVIAASNGHALGGGLVLMLCADFRLACRDETHSYGLMEAAAGVPFPVGPAEIIKHEIAPPVLRYLTLTSDPVSAHYLKAHQLIDDIVETDTLLEAAVSHAARLMKQPAFKSIKQQVRGDLAQAVAGHVRQRNDPIMAAFL